MPATLLSFRSNKHSQNGEDGVLAEILKRLKIDSGWFVEFGAWDGIHLSNTYALLESGKWQGVGIESEEERCKDLERTAMLHQGKLTPICALIVESGENSLDYLLSKTKAPKELDVLSIDIDSYDFEIWKSLSNYNSKIVIVEINSKIPVGVRVRHSNEAVTGGTSFTLMLDLGQSKGYTLVCHTGNMIFVRNDLVGKLGLSQTELSNPNAMFLDSWVPRSKVGWLIRGISNKVSSLLG